MADPRLEQERILPRLQRLLDVVSSWADPMPGARAPHEGVVSAADAVSDAITDTADGLAAHGPAGAGPARPASVGPEQPAVEGDRHGDPDTLRGHAAAAGKVRRHTRATEPIWHALSGQDAGQDPGLPATLPGLPGAGPGEPARAGALATHGDAPGTHAGDAFSTAISDDRPGASSTRLAAGTIPAAGTDRSSGGSAWPASGPVAAAPARDAIVQEPLLGQDTPPLFGRAKVPARARTGGDAGALATQVPGPGRAGSDGHPPGHPFDQASGNTSGGAAVGSPAGAAAGTSSATSSVTAGAPWRASAAPGEPTTIPGHTSARTGAAPGSLLRPPDLLGSDERTPAWPEPAPVSAMLQPDGPGAQLAPPRPAQNTQNAAGTVEHAFAHAELEDQLADVLERAALEAGVDLA